MNYLLYSEKSLPHSKSLQKSLTQKNFNLIKIDSQNPDGLEDLLNEIRIAHQNNTLQVECCFADSIEKQIANKSTENYQTIDTNKLIDFIDIDSLPDKSFDELFTDEKGVLINLDSPDKNSYLLTALENSGIEVDFLNYLTQEKKSEILQLINDILKAQLNLIAQENNSLDIFYTREYQTNQVVQFLKYEYRHVFDEAIKKNKNLIKSALDKIEIVYEKIDDLSDNEFRKLLIAENKILIDLDSPGDNQRLLALLKNKNIFSEQNFDILKPAVKIAFLNKVNEILKTSIEIYVQETTGANLFYVRKNSDGTKARFLKKEYFYLIDEIINQDKELIAKTIKSILQQSTSQSLPRVLEVKPIARNSAISKIIERKSTS